MRALHIGWIQIFQRGKDLLGQRGLASRECGALHSICMQTDVRHPLSVYCAPRSHACKRD